MVHFFVGLRNSLYWYPAIVAFVFSATVAISLVILRLIIAKSRWKNSILHQVIFRLGGLAMILGFLGAIFLDSHLVVSWKLWGVIVAIGVTAIAGVWDDLVSLDWKTQLFVHCILGLLIVAFGVEIEIITIPFGGVLRFDAWSGAIGMLFLVAWVVVFINAMNWLDGVDGLSGSVTLIGALTVFGISLRPEVNQPPMGIMSMALAGAAAGLLLLNFYPAKLTAGSSGSVFMGFMLAVFGIFAGAKLATALLVMAIPLADACWVIIERSWKGHSIFQGKDQRHLHYKLVRLGWSPWKICWLFSGISLILAAVALTAGPFWKMATFVTVFGVVLLANGLLLIKLQQEYE